MHDFTHYAESMSGYGTATQLGAWHHVKDGHAIAVPPPPDALPDQTRIKTPYGDIAVADLSNGDVIITRSVSGLHTRKVEDVAQYFWVGYNYPGKDIKIDLFTTPCGTRSVLLPLGWTPCDAEFSISQTALTPSRLYKLEIREVREKEEAVFLNDIACMHTVPASTVSFPCRVQIGETFAPIYARRNGYSLFKLSAKAQRLTISGANMRLLSRTMQLTLWDSNGMSALAFDKADRSGDQITIDLDRKPGHIGILAVRF